MSSKSDTSQKYPADEWVDHGQATEEETSPDSPETGNRDSNFETSPSGSQCEPI
ncbi:MAG TPA: hypothetical protein VMR37_04630 [Rhabdochlamydiaceae bacterium]|nr:hypothetical protein [Rhabdochlamydiaceae bacterium]